MPASIELSIKLVVCLGGAGSVTSDINRAYTMHCQGSSRDGEIRQQPEAGFPVRLTQACSIVIGPAAPNLWASQPQCSKPLWRRRGPGSGSAPGGLGCAVEDAWPGTGSGSVDGGPWPKSCGKSGEGQVRVPIGPLAGCQKTLTQTPQHPPKQHRGLRNGCPSVDHTIPTVMTAAAPPPSGLSVSTDSPFPLPLHLQVTQVSNW